jgi:hypothetical protein
MKARGFFVTIIPTLHFPYTLSGVEEPQALLNSILWLQLFHSPSSKEVFNVAHD